MTPPERPYKELGIVHCIMVYGDFSNEKMDKELLRRAKEAGADAIMDIKREYGTVDFKGSATAIVFTE